MKRIQPDQIQSRGAGRAAAKDGKAKRAARSRAAACFDEAVTEWMKAVALAPTLTRSPSTGPDEKGEATILATMLQRQCYSTAARDVCSLVCRH